MGFDTRSAKFSTPVPIPWFPPLMGHRNHGDAIAVDAIDQGEGVISHWPATGAAVTWCSQSRHQGEKPNGALHCGLERCRRYWPAIGEIPLDGAEELCLRGRSKSAIQDLWPRASIWARTWANTCSPGIISTRPLSMSSMRRAISAAQAGCNGAGRFRSVNFHYPASW